MMNRPITLRTQLVLNGLTLVLVALMIIAGPTVLAATSFQSSTQSTSTSTLPYQGHLTDAAGTAITDSLPMTFKLYAAQSGGEPLWTEERSGSNAVPVRDGLFTVQLGSVTPIPASLLAQPLWLGISVDGDAEMAPREIIQTPAMAQRLNQPVMTLLGEKTCTSCETTSQTVRKGWHTVMGSSADDPIAVTVTTHGGPVRVEMTARFLADPAARTWCGISIPDFYDEKIFHIDGISSTTPDFGCSGSYLFTDLPAGTYTFISKGFVGNESTVVWNRERQIAVYEFLAPENQ